MPGVTRDRAAGLDGDSNFRALDLGRKYPQRFAVVARFDVKAPGAAAERENRLAESSLARRAGILHADAKLSHSHASFLV
jgi:hypothetical protein